MPPGVIAMLPVIPVLKTWLHISSMPGSIEAQLQCLHHWMIADRSTSDEHMMLRSARTSAKIEIRSPAVSNTPQEPWVHSGCRDHVLVSDFEL